MTTSTNIYINGRFLHRPVTGVERFASELLHAVDDVLGGSPVATKWIILTPEQPDGSRGFRNIEIRQTGTRKGHLWEQLDLFRASRTGILINLCNSGPVMHSRQLTVLHDALVYRLPEGFSRSYRTLHQALGRILARRSNLATVSEFSKSELISVLGRSAAGMAVIPNAVDHFQRIEADNSVLDTLDLHNRPYLLFVGSPAPNKNLIRAINAFRQITRKDACFVIVGSAAKAFSEGLGVDMPANLIRTGRLSDEHVKALYTQAAALVFPSTYEGFGIPPLEAMSVGCTVIASDIPVMREVCGDAALYFNPFDVDAIAEKMNVVLSSEADIAPLRRAAEGRIAAFSWQKSALELFRVLENI
ncbi:MULTISPECIES: glycosyltransferase family 1 protein [unclassified Rhizobium]|uniref:glycosyltransferase family 4 protein n=1 Tax=unclassified Rhizobium TaxID=2613769 RepID=UPI0011606672|nr:MULTISPECIES: glycosyltransferase family 1 protein [unclassified Rhizobium]TQX85337.1 glycosyltransferase family 1 protein [Rhizobium sp. rho-13.1]TQY09858.1 glycosyltransferase family 1 protein [Rhizobium sp. rho-1.1]